MSKLQSRFFAVLVCCCLGGAMEGASLKSQPALPIAIATVADATYCFARVRSLRPDLLPPSVLVLRMHLQVTYGNSGERALLIPLAHDRKVYTSLAPGTMKVLRESLSLLSFGGGKMAVMKHLPSDVDPDSPAVPENDVFGMIPARGDLKMKDLEEVTVPVYRNTTHYHDPDLRGHRLYLRLRMEQQELDPILEAVLSDRWANLGTPWTGKILSNTLAFDVPASPQASPCVDKRDPNTVTNKPPQDYK